MSDMWSLERDYSALRGGKSQIMRVLQQLIRIRVQVCVHGRNLDLSRLICFGLALVSGCLIAFLGLFSYLCCAARCTGQFMQ